MQGTAKSQELENNVFAMVNGKVFHPWPLQIVKKH